MEPSRIPKIAYVTAPGNNEHCIFDVLADGYEPWLCVGATSRSFNCHSMRHGQKTTRQIAAPGLVGAWFPDVFVNARHVFHGLFRAAGTPLDVAIVDSPPLCLLALRYRRMGLIRSVVYFASDWLPSDDPSIAFAHRLYRRFVHQPLDIFCARRADMTWSISSRINVARAERAPDLRDNPCILKHEVSFRPVNPRQIPTEFRLLYIGWPREEHRLDLLLEAVRRINSRGGPQVGIEMVGNSPYLAEVKALAARKQIAHTIRYHGSILDFSTLKPIVEQCFLGYALYANTSKSYYGYYGFPSKVFHYFSYGIPVIASDLTEFSRTIAEQKLGFVIPVDIESLECAILDAMASHTDYSNNIRDFIATQNPMARDLFRSRINQLLGSP